MSCCIQFLNWNSLSLYFNSKSSFSKNIHYVLHLIFKNGINNIFPSQTSSLLLSTDTSASFANKPIQFLLYKPNTWRHIFAVIVYVLPSQFSYTTALFALGIYSKFRGLLPKNMLFPCILNICVKRHFWNSTFQRFVTDTSFLFF